MPEDRTDWAVLRAMSEDEIERLAAEDEDNPPTDEGHWAEATVYVPPHQDRDPLDYGYD